MRPAFIFTSLIIGLFAANAVAAPKPYRAPLTVSYEIYAGGIHALSASLQINLAKDAYQVSFNAKPYGVIGNLLPWGGIYKTRGKFVKDKFIPQNFDKISQWREDNDKDSFVYKNGVLISQTETDETKKPSVTKNIPVDTKLAENAVDILSGTAELLQQVDDEKPCNFSTVIYDGRRRYTLKFSDLGEENMTANQYNAYNGPAKICEIEMVPIAGFPKKPKGYYKIQEEARTRGQLPRVWLGRSFGTAGQNGPYVPVKIMVKSEYGAVLIHMQKVTR